MSNHNSASENTPLLRDQDGAEAAENNSKLPTWERLKSWVSSHFVNIVLAILLVFFIALFLVTALLRRRRDELPSIPAPGHGPEICSSAGCVLASATLLRSISPRFVSPKAFTTFTRTTMLTIRADLKSSTLVMTSGHMFAKALMPSTRFGRTRPVWGAFRS